ncbi:PQQ-binding-like beta-propeller repeat protein [Phocaeicola sp.]|uniref:outer membrane protein assembly factor BamB family protein n=1 Tax=Phocaeicola sp. TaxID=2773926 RepID=UPI0023C215F3|nr:PQQ-binding-like beta-propeller repeat protein [Phocaeicola sp.]MDE5677312.1 PQQ-binding-like beta-propeller repeat protein [Phocaeicola sp.]
MMFKRIASVVLASCVAGLVSAAYSGRVFVDKNGNNQYDKGERLLFGVSVSDGLHVVQTDKDGRFDLPGHEKARFVFITLPSGYRSNAFYQRIDGRQSAYDFALQPANPKSLKADGSHRFIHISDTHIGDYSTHTAVDGHAASAKDLRDYVQNEDIAFVIHTGDVCRENFAAYKSFLNNENMPASQMFNCIGNHDLGSGAYGEEGFENFFGPAYYSFEVGNVHYIVTPMERGDGRPDFTPERIGQWLQNDLKYVAEGKPVIAFNHSVMTADGHFKFGSPDAGWIDLADYNLKAWVYGHWHQHRMYRYDDSEVLMLCSPGQAHGTFNHTPASFRVLTVDKAGELSSEIRYPYFDKKLTIASIDNGRSAMTVAGKVPLYVNVYSSVSPVGKVTCSYSCQGKNYLAGQLLKQQTDFCWCTDLALPAFLAGQLVTVTVTATFQNGEVSQESSTFRYLPEKNISVKPGGDWANLLQNAAHVPVLQDTLSPHLQLAWIQNIGSNILFSSPIVYQGAVYAASIDDNGKGKAAVVCMDMASGKVRWRYPVRHSIRSCIAVEDGCVFAQDVNGWLYALEASTGQLVWEKDLEMNKQVPLDNGLVTADGIVYAGTGHSLCALRAKSGETVWRNKDWDTAHGTASTLSVHNGVLMAQTFWEAAYANDAQTGKKLWGRGAYGYGGSATMIGDLVYFTSNSSLCVANARTGKRIIQKKFDFLINNLSAPLVTDSEIILATSADGVIAVDREMLEVKWRFKPGKSLIYTAPSLDDPASSLEGSPVWSGETIYIGASDGVLYALNRKTGKLQWKHEFGSAVLGTVAVSGNMLFAADFAGNVYGFVGDESSTKSK